VLTSDLDWAPAWATLALARRVTTAGCSITLFVTHHGPELELLRAMPGVELGWHPNFHPGSDHGATPDAVLDTLSEWVPEAVGLRSHGLVRSTALLENYATRGLQYEASDLMHRHPGLRPMRAWNGVVRLPIFFEDDVQAMHGRPFSLEDLPLEGPGLRVFDFHPIHVALNTADLSGYRSFKADCAARGIAMSEASEEDVARFREPGPGASDLLDEVLSLLASDPDRRGGTLAEVAGGVE